jgi:23S rRNA (adenine2503-C2)-methyltransferase
LVKFDDKKEVEVVFIPEEKRGTLCISSQVGCTLACKFCHTGTQTLVRNLEFYEIVGQVLLAKKLLNNSKLNANLNYLNKITNVVFMGMGEPFFNYNNVKLAIEVLNDNTGLAISNRKTTVSTSGLVPEILKCAKELKVGLAISLHATNDQLRTEIMAINKKYPLNDLLAACKVYNQENPNHKITFEYVMLENINDQEIHAQELVNLISKFNLNAKVNLIPFNSWEGCEYSNSSRNKIFQFQKILQDSKIVAPIRKTRGEDAMAACGQLKSISQRVKQSLTLRPL